MPRYELIFVERVQYRIVVEGTLEDVARRWQEIEEDGSDAFDPMADCLSVDEREISTVFELGVYDEETGGNLSGTVADLAERKAGS